MANPSHDATSAEPRPGRTSREPRVAYVVARFPSLTTTFIERELRALAALGVEAYVLSIRRPEGGLAQTDQSSPADSSPTHLLDVPWTKVLRAHLHFLRAVPATYVRTLAYLVTRDHRSLQLRTRTLLHFGEGVVAAYLLRDEGFDHVHAHFVDRGSTIALCVGRLLDIPYSLTAHARSIFADPVLLPEKLANARFVVTVSEFNKAHLAALIPHLDDDHIHVLHPWVDVAEFQPPARRVPGPRLRIVSVGRLVEKKGHEHLIHACALLIEQGVEVECHIIGEGPLRTHLEEVIAHDDLSDRVTLHGAQAQPAVLEHLTKADVFVLACAVAGNGDRDAMPVALAEAMAMRLPVISTTIVGISEMVRPGAGLLVEPADPAQLADAIRRIDRLGPTGRAQMGARGRDVIADDFDMYAGTRRLAELFRRSVDSDQQARPESSPTADDDRVPHGRGLRQPSTWDRRTE